MTPAPVIPHPLVLVCFVSFLAHMTADRMSASRCFPSAVPSPPGARAMVGRPVSVLTESHSVTWSPAHRRCSPNSHRVRDRIHGSAMTLGDLPNVSRRRLHLCVCKPLTCGMRPGCLHICPPGWMANPPETTNRVTVRSPAPSVRTEVSQSSIRVCTTQSTGSARTAPLRSLTDVRHLQVCQLQMGNSGHLSCKLSRWQKVNGPLQGSAHLRGPPVPRHVLFYNSQFRKHPKTHICIQLIDKPIS